MKGHAKAIKSIKRNPIPGHIKLPLTRDHMDV